MNTPSLLLLEFLRGFSSLSHEEVSDIAAVINVHTYPKGAILLEEGAIASKCYFVLQGCIRQYHNADGSEKTTDFFTENQAVVAFASYFQQIPSKSSFACVEDSTLIVGDPRQEAAMYEQFPKLADITRGFIEQDFGAMQENFARFIASSPQDRYMNLLQTRPKLLQRVPQHQIASYLGVTPESLSRIRRRIAESQSPL